jgi:hypothetical protein
VRKHTPEEAAAAKERAKIRFRAYKKIWASKNKDKIHASYVRCKVRHRASMRAWYDKNKDKVLAYGKEWNNKNRDKRIAYKRTHNLKYSHTWGYKLRSFASHQVRGAIKNTRSRKNSKSAKYLGCSFEFFKQWIQSKFEPWMTWENHGEWHIDHIIPLSTLNEASSEHEIACVLHYSNLRPLSKTENMKKHARPLDYVQPELPLEIAC